MEVQMTARRSLTLSILIVTATLSFATQTYAKWTEVQNGTTYECEEIQSEQCKVRADGSFYDCKNVKKVKCVAVAGPGSGKPAAHTGWDDTPPPPQPMRTFNLNRNAMLATFG
jgi:hypothetical protein